MKRHRKTMRGGTKGSKKSASRKTRVGVSRYGKPAAKTAIPTGMSAANVAGLMDVDENNIKHATVTSINRNSKFEEAKSLYTQLERILSHPPTAHGHPSKGGLWQLYHKFNKSLHNSVRGGAPLPGSGVYFAAQKSLGERVAQRARDLGQREEDIMNALSGRMAGAKIGNH